MDKVTCQYDLSYEILRAILQNVDLFGDEIFRDEMR